jgi:hypothetical protein
MRLRSSVLPALALLAASLSAASPFAQQAGPAMGDAAKPVAVFANVAKLRATVVDVNSAEGLLILRGEDGDEQVVRAGSAAGSLGQIAVGDRVSAEFREATAIFVRKQESAAGAPSGLVERTEAASPEKIELSPLRESQDRTFTHVSEVTAMIRDVDYARRRVTLLGPGGWPRIINVSDNVQNLDDLNEGDLIAIRYTEAVAIGITK